MSEQKGEFMMHSLALAAIVIFLVIPINNPTLFAKPDLTVKGDAGQISNSRIDGVKYHGISVFLTLQNLGNRR